MRIGFDIDGVLANFFSAFENLVIEVSGEDKFPAKYPEISPITWHWPEYYGYPSSVMKEVWRRIKASAAFWTKLGLLPMGNELKGLRDHLTGHEVYFVTARPGKQPKLQTEIWMTVSLGMPFATVLISEEKGMICKALNLDFYVDDKPENLDSVRQVSPNTHIYMPVWEYNKGYPHANKVGSMKEVFLREGLIDDGE